MTRGAAGRGLTRPTRRTLPAHPYLVPCSCSSRTSATSCGSSWPGSRAIPQELHGSAALEGAGALWLLSTSLKGRKAVFTPVPEWIPWPVNFGNCVEIFSMAPFGRYLVNTLIVVSGILAVQLATVTLTAATRVALGFWLDYRD